MVATHYPEIQVLTGLEAVRRRPGMFIGTTDHLEPLLWEIVANAVDEHLACGARIEIRFDGARAIVEDTGRGIPPHQIEASFTCLHGGSARASKHRHLSLDLHGVGCAVTTGLASELEATVWRDGQTFVHRFERGIPTTSANLGATKRTGTRVAFTPDFTIMKAQPWDVRGIRARCRELAGIEPGLRLAVDGETFQFASIGAYLRAGRDVVEPLDLHVVENDIGLRLALGWHAGASEIRTLVNASPAGGVHAVALHAGIRRALERRLGRRIARKTLERGLLAVLHVMLDAPRWGAPTKEWLTNPEVGATVRAVVERELARHFEAAPAVLDALLLRLEASRRRG